MVLVSMVFAYAIRRQGDRGKPLCEFLRSLSHVVFSIIDMINLFVYLFFIYLTLQIISYIYQFLFLIKINVILKQGFTYLGRIFRL